MSQIQYPPLPEDISGLIAITRRLTDLLTAEIAALRAMRPKDIVPLQEEKAELTNNYESRLQALKQDAIELKKIPPELAAELGHSTQLLRDVIADNQRALKAVREVNEDVINVIADEIARQPQPGADLRRARPTGAQCRSRPASVGAADIGPTGLAELAIVKPDSARS